MLDGGWFVRQDSGKPHLVGWYYTAIKGESTGPRHDGWTGLAACPRCSSLVLVPGAVGQSKFVDAHEQWHARTDHPIPAEILAQAEAWRP